MSLITYQDDFNGYKEVIEETVSGGTTTTYVGQAKKGTATSDAKWRVKKIVQVVAGSVTTTTITYAGGKGNDFVFVWDERASLSYS